MKQIIAHNRVLTLMMAGNAELVFHNSVTKCNRMYRIRINQFNNSNNLVVFHGSYFLGYIKDKQSHKMPYEIESPGQSTAIHEFVYLFNHLIANTLNPVMEVYHTGRCCVCYKKLTDPVSIELGIGPLCRDRR